MPPPFIYFCRHTARYLLLATAAPWPRRRHAAAARLMRHDATLPPLLITSVVDTYVCISYVILILRDVAPRSLIIDYAVMRAFSCCCLRLPLRHSRASPAAAVSLFDAAYMAPVYHAPPAADAAALYCRFMLRRRFS